MTNIELYINGKRVDIGRDFGIRINRLLLNPSELNTKDAQMSFSISLPPTQVNHAIFNYANVEETRDKFNRIYSAELIVNSVRTFPPEGSAGLFRMSEVSGQGYKGNLYVPAQKSIKDIFGEIKLNQNPELRIPFAGFVTSVNGYNTAAATTPQYAIFPYTMYGVLPKIPLNKNANSYSARTLWDFTVRMGMQDLPPSINPLLMLKHIFAAQGYNLQGSAFDDDRLTRVYMSYKNPDDYVQPWNYGQHAKIHVRGGWSSRVNYRTGAVDELERGVNTGNDQSGPTYGCDLFDATNTALEIVEDSGGNVLYKEVNDGGGRTYVQAQIRIPTAGFYKVRFNAGISVDTATNWRTTDPATGVQHVGGQTSNAVNDFNDNIYEIRLCRDRKTGDFGLTGPRLNGVFYYNNQPQNQTFDGNNIPKYFPQADGDGQINFVDIVQDKAHLLGFNFGNHALQNFAPFPKVDIRPSSPDFYNPKGPYVNAQVLVAKPALSWDASEAADNPTRLAVKSRGYWKYGRIGTFDNEGDNPNIDLDYSGGPFATGKVLDVNGNPQNPSGGNLALRIAGYYLSTITGFQTPAADWEVSDFIDLANWLNIDFSVTLIDGTPDAAIVAFYDINLQFIGYQFRGPEFRNLFVYDDPDIMRGYYLAGDGGGAGMPTPNPSYSISGYIPILAGQTLTTNTTHITTAIGISYYDTSKTYLGVVNATLSYTAAVDGFIRVTLNVPAAADIYDYPNLRVEDLTQQDVYTNEPITPPSDAAFVRFSNQIARPLTITADNSAAINKVLNRFQLARFYTYRIETDPADNYQGFAYVHNGADLVPLISVEFVAGIAEFTTGFAPLSTVDPKLTLYLTTTNFDVDGTLTISRRIEGGSEDVVDWEVTDKYKIDLNNAPTTYARRGQWREVAGDANWQAQGEANAVVWFDAGELVTIASISSEGRYRRNGMHSTFGWASHAIEFDLSIQPFRVDADWLKVSLAGNGTAVMDWNDPVNFDTDSINLVGFLNNDMKTDDFIDNLCKAFNLRLSQIDAKTFALDVKQSKTAVSSRYINLDNMASVKDRTNSPLGLPSLYKIGFTVDPEEEGYVVSGDNGGGQYETGAIEENVVEQKSNFSYNWFKNITKVETGGNVVLPLPIISKADVWALSMPYPEAMRKRYTDLAYRFWYYGGLLNDLGATFEFNGEDLQIARVSNELAGVSVLNYKNKPFTILDNYFTVLINGSSHYTELEGYVTAAQYQALDGSIMAMFNGDLYYVAELGGYDPSGRNKTKIKLIRKI